MSIMMLVGFAVNDLDNLTMFDNYTEAYRTAERMHRPLLVILNPGKDSHRQPISLADVTATEENRKLVTNYVISVIDADSEHGKTCCKLFDADELPNVVVIDKQQKYQIYNTSNTLAPQVWTAVLRKYKDGEAPAPAQPVVYHRRHNYYPARSYCPNCR